MQNAVNEELQWSAMHARGLCLNHQNLGEMVGRERLELPTSSV